MNEPTNIITVSVPNNIVAMIKMVRDFCPMGLKEAKEAVEINFRDARQREADKVKVQLTVTKSQIGRAMIAKVNANPAHPRTWEIISVTPAFNHVDLSWKGADA